MVKLKIQNSIKFLPIALGSITTLLGLIVIFGWHTKNLMLTKINALFVPMQNNVSIGFILLGLAFITLNVSKKNAHKVMGFSIMCLGLITLSEYAFSINLGIDELFMKHPIDPLTSHQGRMAPNSALCFVLGGLYLFTFKKNEDDNTGATGAILAAFIIALGSISLFGYLTNVPTAYGWGNLTRMAIHTATGFIVIGIGFFVFSFNQYYNKYNKRPSWLPLVIGIASITLTTCLWQATEAYQTGQINKTFLLTHKKINSLIKNKFRTKIQALERMAKRWETQGQIEKSNWMSDANNYIKDFSDFKNIYRIDRETKEKWIASSVEITQDTDSTFHNQVLNKIKKDLNYRDKVLLTNRNNSTLCYFIPISRNNELRGFIIAEFSPKKLFHNMLSSYLDGFNITIKKNSDTLYEKTEPNATEPNQTISFDLMGLAIISSFWPTNETAHLAQSPIGKLFLLTGIFASILLVALIKDSLRIESYHLESLQTNQELQHLKDNLEKLVNERTSELKQKTEQLQLAEQNALKIAADEKNAKMIAQKLAKNLEKSNKELESFTYVASHDLKAPLRNIENLAIWIEEDLGENLKGDIKENMGLLKGRVTRLQILLDDLLKYSRAGTSAENYEMVNTHELITDITSMLNDKTKQINFSISNELPNFQTKKTALEITLRNLINNAIKHHDRSEMHISISSNDLGDFYQFSVQDDGPGIPIEFQARIFDMFHTLKPKDHTDGSGMGLAIIKKEVESQGGEIKVISDPNKRGANFIFTWKK